MQYKIYKYDCPECEGFGWVSGCIMGRNGEAEQIQEECDICGGCGYIEVESEDEI
jgi:DnaJ-class molecular chaperone